jgi:hypothetical protein
MYKEFREGVIEPLVNEGLAPEIAQRLAKDTPRLYKTFSDKLSNMITQSGQGGVGEPAKAKILLNKLDEGVNTFNSKHNDFLKKRGLDIGNLSGKLENLGTRFQAIGQTSVFRPTTTQLEMVAGGVGGIGLKGANLAGRTVKGMGDIKNWPANKLNDMVKNAPEGILAEAKRDFDALAKAVNSGDTYLRDVALYALMQRPKVREYITTQSQSLEGQESDNP